MLLRNYDNIMVARKRPSIKNQNLSTKLDANETNFSDGNIIIKNEGGSLVEIRNTDDSCNSPFNLFGEYDISGGTGTGYSNLFAGGYLASVKGTDSQPTISPMSYDDYRLSSYFSSSEIAVVSSTQKLLTPVYNEQDNSWTYTYQRTFSAKVDVVLAEIGISYNFYKPSSTDTCLVYREVLDTPVEVPADASFVLTFTMTISANENKPADYAASVNVEE